MQPAIQTLILELTKALQTPPAPYVHLTKDGKFSDGGSETLFLFADFSHTNGPGTVPAAPHAKAQAQALQDLKTALEALESPLQDALAMMLSHVATASYQQGLLQGRSRPAWLQHAGAAPDTPLH